MPFNYLLIDSKASNSFLFDNSFESEYEIKIVMGYGV